MWILNNNLAKHRFVPPKLFLLCSALLSSVFWFGREEAKRVVFSKVSHYKLQLLVRTLLLTNIPRKSNQFHIHASIDCNAERGRLTRGMHENDKSMIKESLVALVRTTSKLINFPVSYLCSALAKLAREPWSPWWTSGYCIFINFRNNLLWCQNIIIMPQDVADPDLPISSSLNKSKVLGNMGKSFLIGPGNTWIPKGSGWIIGPMYPTAQRCSITHHWQC